MNLIEIAWGASCHEATLMDPSPVLMVCLAGESYLTGVITHVDAGQHYMIKHQAHKGAVVQYIYFNIASVIWVGEQGAT